MGRNHIEVAKSMGFRIVGLFDTNPDSFHALADNCEFESSVFFNSVEDMLNLSMPDAVVVSTTAPSHCEYVVKAAESGVRFILCEKPMAVSIAECNQMIAACDKHGAVLAINHQMQYIEQYISVKELVNSSDMGGLRSIIVAGSNFGLAMNGIHYFEMFRYITGEEIRSISFCADAVKVPNPRGPQYEEDRKSTRLNSSHRL